MNYAKLFVQNELKRFKWRRNAVSYCPYSDKENGAVIFLLENHRSLTKERFAELFIQQYGYLKDLYCGQARDFDHLHALASVLYPPWKDGKFSKAKIILEEFYDTKPTTHIYYDPDDSFRLAISSLEHWILLRIGFDLTNLVELKECPVCTKPMPIGLGYLRSFVTEVCSATCRRIKYNQLNSVVIKRGLKRTLTVSTHL